MGWTPLGSWRSATCSAGSPTTGTTVFMSTHIVSEVERMADEVGIIHEGRMVDLLSRSRLAALGRPRLVVTLASPDSARRALAALSARGIVATEAEGTLTMTDPGSVERPEDVARLLVGADCPPRAMAVVSDSLETHFLDVTGGVR